jgi:GABA permease
MWLFPWLSYVAIAGMLLVLIAMALTPSHRAEFWTSVISISVALLAFVVFRRRGAAEGRPTERSQERVPGSRD